MKLILVATGETILDQQQRTQGWSDSPLTELGIQHANTMKEKLSSITINKAYCSSSERAIDTAEIILENKSIDLMVERRFKDINYGTFEATPNYIEDTYFHYSDTAKLDYKEAGGEDMNKFSKRVKSIIEEIISNSKCDESILIVTHEFVIKTLINIYVSKEDKNIKYIDKNNNFICLIYDNNAYRLEVESCI